MAYVLAVAVHEHGGHGSACVLLGSHPKALGAFYVDCDDAQLTGTAKRIVALAGPLASLALGAICFALLRRIAPATRPLAFYFTWLLGSIGLMSGAGYPLFSGFSGVGDLGTTSDGALFGAEPSGVWRALLIAFGVLAYSLVARLMCRTIAPSAGGVQSATLRVVKRAAMVSYFTGALAYLAIGLLNPFGWQMIFLSVLPSSLGGTSGLLWMWSIYRRKNPGSANGTGLAIERSAGWICVGAAVVVIYAAVFGPSLTF
jgi:hypothetical protein